MADDLPPLCTPADVRKFTNVSSNYQGLDKQFEEFIPLVSSQIRAFCRRSFVNGRRTEYFVSPNGEANGHKLKLIEAPLNARFLPEVLYNPRGNFREGEATVLTTANIEVDYDTAEITLDGYFTYARKGIRVNYEGGYPVANIEGYEVLDVPEEIRKAAALQCAFLIGKTKAGTLGKTSLAQNAGISENYDRGGLTGLIREASGALLPFRRVLVGRS